MALAFYKQWRQISRAIRRTFIGKMLYDVIFENKVRPIKFIVATRSSEELFWKETMTGQQIASLRVNPEISATVTFNNKEGLPSVYNRALADSQEDDIIVFAHDDIWLKGSDVLEKIRAGTKHFDIIGIAGNRRRIDNQPTWIYCAIEGEKFIFDQTTLSGAVRTGNKRSSAPRYFGPSPAACKLLDGVFLAARRRTLQRAEVKFDEIFDFHVYDMDFCRTAESAGLTLGTWPIDLIHESPGYFSAEGWRKNFEAYKKKWKH